jgi:hypothetical protein
MRSRTIVLASLLLAVTGCGDDGGDGGDGGDPGTPQASGLVESLPSCSDVWQTGETLPEDYDGCVIEGNEVKVFSPTECPSGTQHATYEDRWYAVLGGEIQESKASIYSDKGYARFRETC